MKSWLLAVPVVCALCAGEQDSAIAAKMREAIAQNEVPGAVTVVATRDGISHIGVIGHANAEKTIPLRKDSIFWIASMTKPVTAVAVMMLVDEGKLSIDDPLSKHIPEFGSNGVTLKEMLTHTSGMGEATQAELATANTLADLVPIYAKKPLGFPPGSQWRYCQAGINMLGRVVEVVSGMPLDQFFEQRLFKPLHMSDTTFYLSESQVNRWVRPARREGDALVDAPIGLLNGMAPTSHDRYPAANGGLFSTGPDYARFARMLLRGGELDGKRYLSKASFDLMTSIHTRSLKAGFLPGHGWGLGVGVVKEPQGQTAMSKPGTFGHGGAYGTQAWIDPGSGVAYILMVQRTNFKNSDDSPVRLAFQQAASGTN
ncbi:MAG: beta-lactamase family protein [Acidobacteria bacterium]|nr:beta-lactamase family protein [Acidobacteriota bacterium]